MEKVNELRNTLEELYTNMIYSRFYKDKPFEETKSMIKELINIKYFIEDEGILSTFLKGNVVLYNDFVNPKPIKDIRFLKFISETRLKLLTLNPGYQNVRDEVLQDYEVCQDMKDYLNITLSIMLGEYCYYLTLTEDILECRDKEEIRSYVKYVLDGLFNNKEDIIKNNTHKKYGLKNQYMACLTLLYNINKLMVGDYAGDVKDKMNELMLQFVLGYDIDTINYIVKMLKEENEKYVEKEKIEVKIEEPVTTPSMTENDIINFLVGQIENIHKFENVDEIKIKKEIIRIVNESLKEDK